MRLVLNVHVPLMIPGETASRKVEKHCKLNLFARPNSK